MADRAEDGGLRWARWAEGRPHAPLLVFGALFGIQVLSWPLLVLVGYAVRESTPALTALGIPAVLWLLLPMGSVYGLYIGFSQDVQRQGGCLPAVGIAANGLYLLFGLLILLSAFA